MNKILMILVIVLFPTLACGSSNNQHAIPDNICIHDVKITVISISDWGYGTTTVILDGQGSISLKREDDGKIVENASKEINPEVFLVYIRKLYAMDFFNYKSSYPKKSRSVCLEGDTLRYNCFKEVGDLGTQIIHCQFGDYEKRVMIQRVHPLDLWDIGNMILRDARDYLDLPKLAK